MIGAMVALMAMKSLFSTNPVLLVVQFAAMGLFVWARVTFGRRSFHAAATPTAGGLITHGPYRYLRHPIYTAVCLFGWAGIAAHGSGEACIVGLVLLSGALLRMFCEEKLVVAMYPQYSDYARKTWRMIPYVF